MLIECPFCHAKARLSEGMEGSKVRCSACGKTYLARERGRRPTSSATPKLVAGAVGLGAAAIAALLVMRSGSSQPARAGAAPTAAPALEKVAPPPPAAVAATGWDSPAVQRAVGLHEAAQRGDRGALRAALWGPGLTARDADVDPDDRAALQARWDALPGAEREALVERAVDELVARGADGLLAAWTPFDGELAEDTADLQVVRVSASPAAGGGEERVIEWRFARVDDQWLVAAFGRVLSDAERRRLERGYDVVKLSDGSVVRERQPEPLEHLPDTPPELRARIDALLAQVIDLDLAAQGARAKRELVAIGKPAIPALLTHLYENSLSTREEAIQANAVIVALREMTGQFFGYQPMTFVGSATGTTEERRQSSIRQWFAWWYREGPTFTGPPGAAAGE